MIFIYMCVCAASPGNHFATFASSCRLPQKLLHLLLLSKNPLTLGFHAFQLGAQFTAFRGQLLNFLSEGMACLHFLERLEELSFIMNGM